MKRKRQPSTRLDEFDTGSGRRAGSGRGGGRGRGQRGAGRAGRAAAAAPDDADGPSGDDADDAADAGQHYELVAYEEERLAKIARNQIRLAELRCEALASNLMQ